MIPITEAESSAIVTPKLAFGAVREAFVAAAAPGAASFPVVVAHGSIPRNCFTIKSALGPDLAGLKVGAYFPTNDARGLLWHASTILLIDQSMGRIGTVFEGSAVNCYRTAPADALATDALARQDSEVLTLFRTGHQAAFEAQACPHPRAFSPTGGRQRRLSHGSFRRKVAQSQLAGRGSGSRT